MLTRMPMAMAALFLASCGSQPLESATPTDLATEPATSAASSQSPATEDNQTPTADTTPTTQAFPDQVLASTDDPGPWHESRTIATDGHPVHLLQVDDEVWVTYQNSLAIEVLDRLTGEHIRSIVEGDHTGTVQPGALPIRMTRVGSQVWTTSGLEPGSGSAITIYDIDTGTSHSTGWNSLDVRVILRVDDEIWVTDTFNNQFGIIEIAQVADLVTNPVDASSLWPMEAYNTQTGPGHIVHTGDQVWIANHGANAITVFDAESHEPNYVIDIPAPRFMLVVDDTVWVSNNGLVSVLDGVTGESVGTVNVGKTGRMVQVGNTVMVLADLGRSIAAVDSSTYEIIQTITPSNLVTNLVLVGDEVWVIQDMVDQIMVLSDVVEGQERSE